MAKAPPNPGFRPPIWAIALAAVMLCGLLTPLPEGGRARNALIDLGHAPAFALLSWVLIARPWNGKANRRRAGWGDVPVAVLLFLLGAGAEALQPLVGRHAGWGDVAANAAGVAAGWTAAQSWLIRRWRYPTALLLLLCGCWNSLLEFGDMAWQRWQLPQLASFESSLETRRFETRLASMRRVRGDAAQGEHSLEVELQPGQYPSLTFRWPWPKWDAFQQLEFAVDVADGKPLRLVLKIQDELHNLEHADRYHQALDLTPGWNRIVAPLPKVAAAPAGRVLDLQRIASVQLFAIDLKQTRRIRVDDFRLVP